MFNEERDEFKTFMAPLSFIARLDIYLVLFGGFIAGVLSFKALIG